MVQKVQQEEIKNLSIAFDDRKRELDETRGPFYNNFGPNVNHCFFQKILKLENSACFYLVSSLV